jgi:hypothetical protein
VTPIRFSFRHTTRQDMWRPSGDRIRVKCSGIPTELVTLSIAPVFDKLRTMQLMEPLPIKMVPALNTLWRGAARFSCSDDGMGAFPDEAGAQHSPVTDKVPKGKGGDECDYAPPGSRIASQFDLLGPL